MQVVDTIQQLVKALEAGSYNAAPSTLVQGAALQVEDLSPVMENVTFEEKHIVLQKDLKSSSCKSLLAQFNRQISYGVFGGSAQLEGQIGQEKTGQYERVVVPMAFYSEMRTVTLQATMVETGDGVKADEREARNAAMTLAGDIEHDCFRGQADYSNGGVFDGNPLATWTQAPGMHGVDLQVRQSDLIRNAHDLMFAEYGSDESVVISVGGTLTQDAIEDSSTRSSLAFGSAEELYVDPLVLSHYNKIAFNKERIVLAGSPTEATGASLRKQWVSTGTVEVKASQFLRGKYKPRATTPGAPDAPSATTGVSASQGTAFIAGQVYKYIVTAANELGESTKSVEVPVTVNANGDALIVTITPAGTGNVARFFNVYRTVANGASGSERFIGRVVNSGSSTTTFTDLGNKIPGFVTGFLIQKDTMEMKELAPYSRLKLAITTLAQPEAFFRFTTLAVMQPRKNVILDNLS